jgi:repressor LexA
VNKFFSEGLTPPMLRTIHLYSMTDLTKRQQQILDFVIAFQRKQGLSPTVREICERFGFRSPKAATDHLNALKRKGALRSEPGLARSIRAMSPRRGLVVDVPVFGFIPAGFAERREQDAEGCVSVDVNSIGYKPTKNAFALRVSGDSMIGRHILTGDYVVLEHGPEPRNGEIVAALIDGESTLKTFILKGGKPFLRAENPKYPNLIPAQELVIQGVFRALIRPAKG